MLNRRIGVNLIVSLLMMAVLFAGCGDKPAEQTTSIPSAIASNTPVITTSVMPTTSILPTTSNNPPVTTSSKPPTSSLAPTTSTTVSNVKIIKTEWGIPPLCKTHPLDGGFASCYTCHLAGGTGALKQIDGAHSCDECHEPKGPGLMYNCTGGSPDPMPSCKMCHGPQREYDGTKKH
jgi:hypothetical protein